MILLFAGVQIPASGTTEIPGRMQTDQTLVGASDLINSIPDLLIEIKNDTGSWALPSHTFDQNAYYGVAGGVAGIGLNLLELAAMQSVLVTQPTRDKAISLATEIGDYLTSEAIINGSGTFWNVFAGSSLIDWGYDFGTSGIAVFLAELSNVTSVAAYGDTARDGLTTVLSHVNLTGGLHFDSQLIDLLADSFWYPRDELIYFQQEEYTSNVTYFNGKALGTAGIAYSALRTIQALEIADTGSDEHLLINSSLLWLESQYNVTNGERSVPLSSPSIGIRPTSISNGVSGIVELFEGLTSYQANATLSSYVDEMVDWLAGSNSGANRLRYSAEINGTLSTDTIQLGLSHGVAGNLHTLYEYSLDKGDTWDTTLESLATYLNTFGQATDTEVRYPESIQSTVARNIGSTSYSMGGGGILSIIDIVSDNLGITTLEDDIFKGKAYFYSQASSFNGFSGIESITGELETNPSIGFISSFHALAVSTAGLLEVIETEVAFGIVELGNSRSLPLALSNIGDEPITVSWNDLSTSDVFLVANFSAVIPARSVFNLFISAVPTTEDTFSEDVEIRSQTGTVFMVELSVQSFDLPTLNMIEVIENNSVIDERTPFEFVVNATDSSGISRVDISINGEVRTMTTTVGSDLHRFEWNLQVVQNGTYTVVFSALDNVGNLVETTYVYTVGIYDAPLDERVFSETTLIILVGVIVILVIAAVVVTRRYMN